MPPTPTTEERLREEFIGKFTVWNDKFKLATLSGVEEYPTPDIIADWWLAHLEEECRRREKELTAKVNRVEVIDHTKSSEEGGGRAYVFWKRGEKCENHRTTDCPICSAVKVDLLLQDNARTLKVFISNSN